LAALPFSDCPRELTAAPVLNPKGNGVDKLFLLMTAIGVCILAVGYVVLFLM